jgi:hypothetical protein
MKNISTFIRILSITIFLVFFTSCQKDDFLDKQPSDRLSSDTFWKTKDDAIAGLTAVYDALAINTAERELAIESMGLMDLYTPIGNIRNAGQNEIASATHTSTNAQVSEFWDNLYRGVVRATDFLVHIDDIPFQEGEDMLKARLKGEASFLRALYYYFLAENFGDVPLFTKVPSVEDRTTPRSPRAEVILLMKNDLEIAISSLPASYSGDDIGRATQGAALTLKVKTALLEKDWSTAATAAKRIMNLGYSLVPDFGDVISPDNENNEEVIFDIQFIYLNDAEPGAKYEKMYANRSAAANGQSWVQPSLYMIDKFEVIDPNPNYEQEDKNIPTEIYDYFEGRDPRMDHTVIRPGGHFIDLNNKDIIYPFKFRNFTHSATRMISRKYVVPGSLTSASYDTPLNFIIFRYADVLLNYLEAEANLVGGIENVSQEILDQTINTIRARASDLLPLRTAGNISWEDLYDERIRELSFEGWLYSDFRRWGFNNLISSGYIPNPYEVKGFNTSGGKVSFNKKSVNVRDYTNPKYDLFPIPLSEIDRSENSLTQNPAYN